MSNSKPSKSLLLAYLFYPFVYVMGIPVDEVLPSAMLVGQKTAFNEFLAFSELGLTLIDLN